MKKNNVYLWTGNGWGKTTSALGVSLRAIGHGHKVIIIQFMKGRKWVGEYKVRNRLKPNYQIYQFGRKEFINLRKPSAGDKKLARKGFEFAKQAVKKKPNLLILDEINLAVKIGLLNVDEVIDFLDKVPKSVTVYLTGRYAPKKLVERADYVTEVRAVKHPPIKKRQPAKKGIDY
ncbi:cob(I)yrinic acid a,c-diamide adenosyltransferase [Candidatus Woesearchaeota archaeon]|nr:cob(I)yrinic acid a,c-diamide adenosyltransferase [Candidatus Woesearchaeota archaeon]